MRVVRAFRQALSIRQAIMVRNYSSSEQMTDISEPIARISKIMMSCPKSGLNTMLDQSGVRVDPQIVEEVLKRFENAGMVAFWFFEWASKQRNYTHSIKAYHAMISSLAKIRQYEIMWDLVNAMRKKELLNIETFCIIMRKYARAQKIDQTLYTFNVMEKYGVVPNLAAFNGLLSALCKSKNVRKAQEIFDKMKDQYTPDPKTFSILLEGWGKAPNLPKARETFTKMVDAGCSPDIVTYSIMVDILCKSGRVDEAVNVVKTMDSNGVDNKRETEDPYHRSNGCKPTSFIYSILVHTYGIENRIEDAIDMFLEMAKNGIEADVAMYNSLISAFCKVNKMRNAYRVLEEMDTRGVAPNARTCNIILSALIIRKENDEAFRVFRRMRKMCEFDADTYTMMVKMFCEGGEVEMAMKVWKYMKMKGFVASMHTYSVLINGLCERGECSKACVYLEEMIEKGIQPSGLTFGRLRQLLIKQGRQDVLEFLQGKMNLLVKEPLCD